ncbi:MAG: ABC transporter ATP-binding protein [Methanobrevibacter sp.]|uniref:ATP-binding cassette domain-containing protein n=1 Tax=Methanobrevibacter sp. TaxID=66852 RepID=UPI0026DFBE34|nr:ABC transporter ATP-binding protein [Methanobrevibacter sp.]MDO5849039.1 ABC transporter ATP-binding protein [Methanobrevibacter sp.]
MSKIKFENISKKYGDKTVVDDFNMEINEGEFITIIGSSGSGKTTVLKMINGLINPTSGNIYIDGVDISKLNKVDLRRKTGYAIQGNVLFPHLNVEENINFVLNLDKNNSLNVAKDLIKTINLDEDLLERMPYELSGGQQQRVGIARSLAANPDILLMDEPFGAIDEITREQLQDEIKRIHKNKNLTIVFITHDIREALYLADKVIVMNNGKIEQYGTPEEIINNPKTDFVKKLTRRVS